MFFYLRPSQSHLSDANVELIEAYQAIQDRHDLVSRYLRRHASHHSHDYYYEVRASTPRSLYAKAARTIYLNRTCWNALYRVNLKGEFNVPIGTKDSVLLPTDNFRLLSESLESATIRASDFQDAMDGVDKGDFVFVDPPYTVRHNYNGFVKYNEKIFTWEDQERLRDSVDNVVCRGAKVLVTNANHRSVRDLYSGFKLHLMERSSVIAGKPSARGVFSEVAIQCW